MSAVPVIAMGDEEAAHRQQDLYFNELFQLKIACEYMRLYRNDLAGWVTCFAAMRAIASSGAIATWAVVKSYPLVWGGIIAASQLADALRDVIPFTAHHKAASALSMTLDALLIERFTSGKASMPHGSQLRRLPTDVVS